MLNILTSIGLLYIMLSGCSSHYEQKSSFNNSSAQWQQSESERASSKLDEEAR